MFGGFCLFYVCLGFFVVFLLFRGRLINNKKLFLFILQGDLGEPGPPGPQGEPVNI